MDGLRIGVLGCADIAWRRTVPAMLASGLRLVAVASRDEDKALRFARRFGCDGVRGYERLLERADVDAVYVPLPNALHAGWAEAALEAGKHVLVEKSFTASAVTAEKLTGQAAARGLLLMENFAFLHHSQHQTARRLVAEGAVGEPRHVIAEFAIPPGDRAAIRYRPELDGGSLMETGTYTVRAAQLFLDPGLTVAGAVLQQEAGGGVDVAGSALLYDAMGVTAQCVFGMSHMYRCAYSVLGSTGKLTVDWAFTPPPSARPVLRLERQDHREERVLAADDQFANMVRRFAEDVHRPSAHRDHAADIVRQARLLEAVSAAVRLVRNP
ncbi:Gfo/Idh/MocA family oxidoreductase [Sphaerisporangium sp. TRM90804]|uniref:Gfo/Idh/MocA family protein n=1 Tax=Sphaerisporangium sp. TRM90804 TaxID=3031113 RepID=UPI00244B4D77|nr:Gfo/Idh/MocA family oxidoreductase [Sphaerisporangium sp. TRM90804]MDH2427198.1 Gfo/Idh/MocA family oxidoreductase [Sphaerisporangium sp. TRM90804]